MKYWLIGVLLFIAAAPADAQLFKKKKKPLSDSALQAQAARVAERQAAAAEAEFGNQQLSIDDLIDMLDHRDDSSYVRSIIVKAGFNRHAPAEKNQMVHMGDTARGVTKYTEMVFVQTNGKEIQLVQFCTRHPDKFQSIRTDLRSSKRFTGQPALTEEGEMSESFYTRDYQILIESYAKKTRFVVSVWLRGANLKP